MLKKVMIVPGGLRLKPIFYIIAVLFVLIPSALLYIAFIYEPKSDHDFQSSYVNTIHSQRLKMDQYIAHYVHVGSGDPVILIHGGGTWLYSFRENIPVLSRRFSVYAVDMPGHGYTTSLVKRPKYDLETYSKFLLDFMDRQKIKKASLVGNSWGGGWALYFTERHPERVDKLILIDSSGINTHDVLEWEAFKIPVLGEVLSKFINRTSVRMSLEKVFYNKDKVNEAMVNEIYGPFTRKENRQAQYLAERNLNWRLTAKKLSSVTNKTLVIWGKNDRYLNYQAAYRFKENMKDTKLMVLENCGHVAHEERPEIVNQAIMSFLIAAQ